MVLEPPTAEDLVTQMVVLVRQPGDPRPSLCNGVDMLELSTTSVEW